MFQKAIRDVIEQGIRNLEEKSSDIAAEAKRAQEVVERCKGEICSLVTLSEDVQEKIFDRYSKVMVATIEFNPPVDSFYPRIGLVYGREVQLNGLMGPEGVKPGKYRAIVLLELL